MSLKAELEAVCRYRLLRVAVHTGSARAGIPCQCCACAHVPRADCLKTTNSLRKQGAINWQPVTISDLVAFQTGQYSCSEQDGTVGPVVSHLWLTFGSFSKTLRLYCGAVWTLLYHRSCMHACTLLCPLCNRPKVVTFTARARCAVNTTDGGHQLFTCRCLCILCIGYCRCPMGHKCN